MYSFLRTGIVSVESNSGVGGKGNDCCNDIGVADGGNGGGGNDNGDIIPIGCPFGCR